MRTFAAAFVLGTLLLQRAAALPELPLALAGLASLLALSFVARVAARIVLLATAGILLGYGLAAWRAEARLADVLPPAWEGRDIALEGVVASLPQAGEKGTRFLLDVVDVHTPGAYAPARVSLAWYADARGGAAPPRVAPGERWSLVVRLRQPRGLLNPHGFDFEPWALERGIRA
ncbi:MAG TPA: ComEC/Rec2 family competence protein, partial [Usitatibacter sp.]|nr:ComEC/Rec2 family competence protein [Usitatibacter sp.]